MSQRTSWWCKSRRAKSKDDFETWLEGGVAPTLNAFDNGDTRAVVLILENNRRDGARLYEDVAPTLQGFMGTGGGNVSMVFPIQDGREMEKSQNGLGIGSENDPAYTLDRTGAQAIAIQGNVIGRADTAGPQGKGYTEEGEPMFTLTKTDVHAVAGNSIVRRLTPTEYERLQGFPDQWTKFGVDKKEGANVQADSHRYEQMGNAVAVPVVDWIVKRLVEIYG